LACGASSKPLVDLREMCSAAAASRRSLEFVGGSLIPVWEPNPALPAFIAGFNRSASAGSSGVSGACAALERDARVGFALLGM